MRVWLSVVVVMLRASVVTPFVQLEKALALRPAMVLRSMPPNMSPEQMKMAAEAMKNMDASTIEMMLKEMETMSPGQLEEMKRMGMNPDMLKMSMRLLKANPMALEMAKKQMSKMTPEQMAEASAQAQKQMEGMSPNDLQTMASRATQTVVPEQPEQPAVDATPEVGSARDPKLIEALFTTAEFCASPPTGGVDIRSFKLLPPIAALRGTLPDDLSDDEIEQVWAEVTGGTGRLDRDAFERVWIAIDELYDDDLMVEMRRPPKKTRATD